MKKTWTHGWPRVVVTGLIVSALLSLTMVYSLTYHRADQTLINDSLAKAQLKVLVLQSELEKQRAVSLILADDSDVIRALTEPDLARSRLISKKLEKLQSGTRSAVIYIVDRKGVTLSASNWSLPSSFVGSNYSFRAYFRQALQTGRAEQFALGTVSRKPGLYLAHRVMHKGLAVGVVVVKVEFDQIERSWWRSEETTFVTDTQNEILLTSRPELRFRPGLIADTEQILTKIPAPAPGWNLSLLSSRQPARRAAEGATLTVAMAELLVMSVLLWLWRRQVLAREKTAEEARYRENLEKNVAHRTQELRTTNSRLQAEIRDRQQAEQKLSALQADLVQANKLASLGQITAGVAHEINQPLATIRLLAENAQAMLKRPAKAQTGIVENLGSIIRMSERISLITGDLRAFSRKANAETEPVRLKDTIESSILLNSSRLRTNRVRITVGPLDPTLQVMGGRIRLEQVLVNLLQNASEALEDHPEPQIWLTTHLEEDWVILSVRDNGPGLSPEIRERLFTPFVTTKPKGLGLGLVIAHDILRDFGGEISAENQEQGAVFNLRLRRVRP